MYRINEIRRSMISHKHIILFFLVFLLSSCCLGNTHTAEFSYIYKASDNLQSCHSSPRPLIPVAYLIREDHTATKSGTVSEIGYKKILDEIQSQKRFRHLSRLLFGFIGVIFTCTFAFFTHRELKRIHARTYNPFLTHIIRYIHNQDGEKASTSPVHF